MARLARVVYHTSENKECYSCSHGDDNNLKSNDYDNIFSFFLIMHLFVLTFKNSGLLGVWFVFLRLDVGHEQLMPVVHFVQYHMSSLFTSHAYCCTIWFPVTWWVPLVEQELFNFLEHLSTHWLLLCCFAQSFVCCIVFCGTLFVFFSFFFLLFYCLSFCGYHFCIV